MSRKIEEERQFLEPLAQSCKPMLFEGRVCAFIHKIACDFEVATGWVVAAHARDNMQGDGASLAHTRFNSPAHTSITFFFEQCMLPPTHLRTQTSLTCAHTN